MSENSDYIWYFSFGANMDKNVLQKRRKVIPKESRACIVPSYRIVFNYKGLMYWEPGFASIAKVEDNGTDNDEHLNELHGVAHLITKDDYLRIRYTEGGSGYDGYGYADVDVKCIDYNRNEFTAKALILANSSETGVYLPSLRYLSLLRKGAREHNLDQKWIDYLDRLESYEHDWRSKLGSILCLPLILCFLLPLIPSYMIAFYRRNRPSLFMVKYQFFVHEILWALHDMLLVHIFGSGADNKGRKN